MKLMPGHVSLIRFPRTDLEEGKYRPVLLLAEMPGPFHDWVVCAITSQLRHVVVDWDEEIKETDDDFEASGLKSPSLIRVGKLATVEEEVLEGVLGEISSQRLATILLRIAEYLGRQASERTEG